MRKGSSWPPDKGIGVGATLEGRRCDFEGRRAASSCIRQLLVWRRWATARAPSPAPPPDNVGLPIAKLSKRATWHAHCFEGARGRANRVNFYNQQTQNNQSRLWKFGGCKGAMLKRLKKEIVILFNIFLGLRLCTSEFSQSTFGCSRVCERRVCRRFWSCGSGPPWYWYCWGPGLRQKFVLWQMALDLGPPRLPKKTEKCVCHMGKIQYSRR